MQYKEGSLCSVLVQLAQNKMHLAKVLIIIYSRKWCGIQSHPRISFKLTIIPRLDVCHILRWIIQDTLCVSETSICNSNYSTWSSAAASPRWGDTHTRSSTKSHCHDPSFTQVHQAHRKWRLERACMTAAMNRRQGKWVNLRVTKTRFVQG